jgi:hypothetical protein
MLLTPRDEEIVLRVYEHRFLSRDQIAALFFPAAAGARSRILLSSCNARLQRLYQHGYLDRQTLHDGSPQAVYALDRRGAALVAARRSADVESLHWRPKQRRAEQYFLRHTLAINDVWVAFELATRRGEAALEEWVMDGPALWDRVADRRSPRGYLPVRPDAYCRLALGGRRAHFFLEVDRATMPNRRVAEKVRAYQRYWRAGRFEDAYGAASFRVLVTAPSTRRRENLRRTAAAAGARAMFLFAVHGELVGAGPFAPIWTTPIHETPRTLAP